MAVAEGHDLVAFQLLVPVEADVVTALLGSCCRAIPVDDGDIKKLVLVKFQYGALKNGVDAAIGFPSSPSTIDARVVDLGTTFAILVDRQLLPLTAQIEQVQNVVEDLEQTQLRCRPTAADGKVWQDKLLEQCETQLRGNRLPTMASSHSSPPENRILSDLGAAAENPASRRLSGKFGALEKHTTNSRPKARRHDDIRAQSPAARWACVWNRIRGHWSCHAPVSRLRPGSAPRGPRKRALAVPDYAPSSAKPWDCKTSGHQ